MRFCERALALFQALPSKKSVLLMIAYAAMRFCERALAPFQALPSKKICSSDDRIGGDAFL